MLWSEIPKELQRQCVRGAVEESSGQPLPVSDPLPDELIAAAEAEDDADLEILREFIYSRVAGDRWSPSEYVRYRRAVRETAGVVGVCPEAE